jgi:hypothetical protein
VIDWHLKISKTNIDGMHYYYSNVVIDTTDERKA